MYAHFLINKKYDEKYGSDSRYDAAVRLFLKKCHHCIADYFNPYIDASSPLEMSFTSEIK
jgi:hypothetical protein